MVDAPIFFGIQENSSKLHGLRPQAVLSSHQSPLRLLLSEQQPSTAGAATLAAAQLEIRVSTLRSPRTGWQRNAVTSAEGDEANAESLSLLEVGDGL